jgi:hypothetical protein
MVRQRFSDSSSACSVFTRWVTFRPTNMVAKISSCSSLRVLNVDS